MAKYGIILKKLMLLSLSSPCPPTTQVQSIKYYLKD